MTAPEREHFALDWGKVAITPILGDMGQPLWLVVWEREVSDRVAA